jgi:hypothetical protein
VRFSHRSRLALPAAAALGLALFVASLTWQVPATRAGSGPLDAQVSELVRLINGDRAAEGLAALSVDPFLASKARDGAIPCPDDPAQSIAGRAQDFAAWGDMSHSLRLCAAPAYTLSGTLFVSMLGSAWSYWNVGEIDLVNGGYGSGAFLYSFAGAQTWQTWTYSTTGNAMMGWRSSSSHWSIIVGSYDRVGCGGWASGSTYYYDCLFSAGGSSPDGLQAPPTASPFSNPLPNPTPAPTAARTANPPANPTAAPPTRAATAPPAGPIVAPTDPAIVNPTAAPPTAAPPTAGQTASASPTAAPPTAGQTASASPVPAAPNASPTPAAAIGGVLAAGSPPPAPVAEVAAMQETGGLIGPTVGGSGPPVVIAGMVAVVAGSGAVALSGWSLFLSLRRRRRNVAI